ncbi:unnamed protein product, partial [Closterium sp. NIES-54]
MALLRVLPFDPEGRPVAFETWHDDLQLYLLSDSRDSVSLFDLVSDAAPAPPATADVSSRSQWLSRDATARLAIRNHLPATECAHFGEHRTAHALYDAVVARYSSPATAALGRLLLPYLFPELSAFATVADLVTHLRTSDARYRATVLADFLLTNQPPMFITLYFIVTRLPDSLRSVKTTSSPSTPLPSLLTSLSSISSQLRLVQLLTSVLLRLVRSAATAKARVAGVVEEAAVVVEVAVGVAVGAAVEEAEAVEVVAAVEAAEGVAAVEAVGPVVVGLDLSMEALVAVGASRSSVRARLRRLSSSAELLRSGVAIYDIDFDVIISAMYALSFSAEGDCYWCVPPDPGIAAAALGASASGTPPGIAPAAALHTFTLDSGASRCFFRDCTTLTPLPAPIPVWLADPSGGPVVARSSTVLPCSAVPSGSLSGIHLPSFCTNLVSTTALQDAMVTITTPKGQRVSICTCTRTGRHLATFTRRPGSSLYTLATEPPQVAVSAQVSASSQVAASFSCRLLSHQTLLWHHRLGHPSLPRLRGMHSRLLVSGLPKSLPPLPPSPAPPCLPCVGGRQRATPHSSFPPTTAPLQTLHMDVKGEVSFVLIPWIRTVRLQLRERFGQDLPVLRLHSDRGGEFSSDLLRDFCRGEGILQSFTLPDSPQQNGIAERRIGLVMEVARTSMIHAAAPHFLWPFAVRYAAHQLNLWPRISLPETSPTLRWTGKVGDASVFRWHDTLRTTLAALGFAPSTADPSLFLRTDTSLPPFYILVYVDDLVFATADTAGLAYVKSELQKRHTCTDLGELRSYLGLQITRDRAQRTITLTQSHMVLQVLLRFGFTYSSPQATPLPTRHSLSALPSDESVEPSGPYVELVGCLMYLMTCTRPDLAYPLSILARYVAPGRHRPEHMAAAKRVLRYVCSTSGMGLVLGGRSPVVLTGHADASWADDQATQRSSQGYTFGLGSGSVSWRATRSSSVLGSSCEAEIYAGAMAAQELRWLTYLLTDLGEPPRSPPVLYVDNKAMLALCREQRLEHRTKHIALRYFLARELQQRGQLRLVYVASEANTADVFTKALAPCDHQRCCTQLDPLPVQLAIVSGAAPGAAFGGAASGGAEPRGAGSEGAGSGGAEPKGVELGGAESEGAEPDSAETKGVESGGAGAGGAAVTTGVGDPSERRVAGAGGAGARVAGVGGPGAGGAGAAGAGAVDPASPLPVPSPYTEQSGSLTERREPASRAVSLVRTARRAPHSRPPPVPGTHTMALRPSSVPLRVLLPAPPDPTVARLLATAVTDPSFESAAASALVAELLDFPAACRLDNASALVADSVHACPPSVGAAVPRFSSLLTPEGDPDAPDIPTPRSYVEAITCPYSSQWQAAMDAEMASWKSRGTYVDEVPPPGMNIVDGMWIFRVKRPPGSPPAFKARYVARGFTDPSLFLRTDTLLPPFYVVVYVDELVFATADTE